MKQSSSIKERGTDFCSYLNEDKETLTHDLYFEGEDNGFQVEVALQYNDGFSDNILSFVNNVRTKDGGTHETTRTQVSHYQGYELTTRKGWTSQERKDKNLEGSRLSRGLAAVLSILVPGRTPQFEGQAG